MAERRAPNRVKLTDDRCEKEAYGGGRHLLWDTKDRGLALRVYPSGRKAFCLAYRVGGRRRFMTLGAFPTLSVKAARTAAQAATGKAAVGRDPLAEREAERREATTVKAYVGDWLDRGGRRPGDKAYMASAPYRLEKSRLQRYVLPALGRKRLASITRADVDRLHRAIRAAGGPAVANRTVELFRAILARAVKAGLLDDNPAAGSRRSKKAAKEGRGFRERPRTTFLSKSEFARFATEVERVPDVFVREALWLLLLLPVRSASELLRLRWSDVDLERRVVRVYQTKVDEWNTVPLSDAALGILSALPREHGSPWLFPSPRNRGQHRRTIRRYWEHVREEADLAGVTLHDLRRTSGSLLADAGFSVRQISEVLGHQDERVTEVYAVISGEKKRQTVNALGVTVEAFRAAANGSREADATEVLQAEREALLARLSEVEAALA